MVQKENLWMQIVCLLLIFDFFCMLSSAESFPYGICAHVSRPSDHYLAEQEFELMHQAGISWVRTDFDWTTVKPRQDGPWDFSVLDATVEKAEQAGINILPILAYDTPWATPAYKHLDKWIEYVRNTVSRYHRQLRYWEVWNEPDLEQFWKDKPNPADYTALLKATYTEIKKIDLELKVLLGGLSGIPYEYIEGIYQAGGKDFFDIMAVHPYRYPNAPEQHSLKDDLDKLRQLMTRYGDAEKPVWITEIGWPTHQNGNLVVDEIIRVGLNYLESDRKNWILAVLSSPEYPNQFLFSEERLRAMLPGSGEVVHLNTEQIKLLNPQIHNALMMPPDEAFPSDCFDIIEDYVRNGGIVLFTQGVPLYYTVRRDNQGNWVRNNADPSYRKRLHIGWEAWWTHAGVPRQISKLSVPDGFRSQVHLPDSGLTAERFLTDAELKTGDKFIPLLETSEGNYKGSVAAIFDLNSDLKGAVIVSALIQDLRGISEQQQAAILPRAWLTALHSGAECVFWYNFRAFENNPCYNEDHFGIVHKDLHPKPAYRAMQTLTRARPAGSTLLSDLGQTDDLFYCGWKRPDGQNGFAVWTTGKPRNAVFPADGEISEAFDNYGMPAAVKQSNNTISLFITETPLYLIGRGTLLPAH